MKTKLFFTVFIMVLIQLAITRAQVVNTTFGNVKGWKGNCKVIIVDSTAEAFTEYRFEGPAILQNELDMSPYNTSWPNPSVAIEDMNTENMEEMMNFSKAQDDKWRVWEAQVKVDRRVKYNDGMSKADYTCTFNKTEKLKFQIAIIGDEVSIVPDVVFSESLNCTGMKDDAMVLPEEEHRLILNNFKVTSKAPSGGNTRLNGSKTFTDDTRRIFVKWDFSPIE